MNSSSSTTSTLRSRGARGPGCPAVAARASPAGQPSPLTPLPPPLPSPSLPPPPPPPPPLLQASLSSKALQADDGEREGGHGRYGMEKRAVTVLASAVSESGGHSSNLSIAAVCRSPSPWPPHRRLCELAACL